MSFDDLAALPQDLIDVTTIDANTAVGGDQDFSATFIAAGSAFTAAAQIWVIQNPFDLAQRIVQLNTDNDVFVERRSSSRLAATA